VDLEKKERHLARTAINLILLLPVVAGLAYFAMRNWDVSKLYSLQLPTRPLIVSVILLVFQFFVVAKLGHFILQIKAKIDFSYPQLRLALLPCSPGYGQAQLNRLSHFPACLLTDGINDHDIEQI